MKYLILFMLFELTGYVSQAQTFTIRNFGVSEGLPSSEVYDVFQDSKGFLWFSTDNGVVKYDGFNFKSFNVADGLPDPVVFETMEDSRGKIWFRTFSGKIAYVENEKIYTYKFNALLTKVCQGSYLASMTLDSQGKVWFTTNFKWGSIDANGNMTVHDVPAGSLLFKAIEHHHIIGLHKSLEGMSVTINDSTFPVQLTDHVTDSKKSHAATRSLLWKNNQYLIINNNIFKYDGTSVIRVYRGETAIINLSKDQRDNLWVGFFNGGAIRFDNDNFENPWHLKSIGLNSVTKVLEDNEGGIWITTLENGVFFIPNTGIQHYYLNSNSKINTVLSSGNQIMTGEYDGTLTTIDSKSKKILRKKKFTRTILALFKTKKNLWVSAESFHLLNNQNQTIRNTSFAIYRDFTEDDQGTIWGIAGGGSSGGTVVRLNQDGVRTSTKSIGITCRNILAIDSILLIGLHTGLGIYDLELNLIKNPKQLESLKISEIKPLGNSTFLVATIGNGFLITKDFEHFMHYRAPARNIYDVVQYDSAIWLGTEKGILKTSLQSLHTGQASYDFITNRSGLLNAQVSHLVKSGDEVFAFYNNSYSVISATEKRHANQSPAFYIKNLKINNEIHDYSKVLDLTFDQNNLHLDFGFISFNHQDIQVRYRLNPADEWNYLTERAIDLYSLSSGEYAFELQYSVDRIHWTSASNMPAIHISPPWWQTFAFQVALIIVIVSVIYMFFNNRLVIYRQRAEKMKLLSKQQQQLISTEIETLERERNRIAKDLHDSVGTNILATKLTVNRLLKKHQDAEMNAVEEQFQQTMREIKEIIYNLSPPGLERYGLTTGLKNYIERISVSTDVQFTVNSFGEELLDTNLSVPLFRILQELITNSLKHAKANSISIHLNSFDDLYNIVYEDSGKGFSISENHKGLGLHSIESRVLEIHGKIRFQSGIFGVSYSIDIPIQK